MIKYLFIPYLLFFELFASEIIVTADKIMMPESQTPTSITVITQKQLKAQSGKSLSQLLNHISGLDIAQNGSNGQTSNVFIRGAQSSHSLVLIDGIEQNDPIGVNRSFDFSHLNVNEIEKIEILKGSQSVLYGSDAIGGVIKITTKQGRSINFGGDSNESFNINATSSHQVGIFKNSVHLGHQKSKGLSAARGGAEKDGFYNYNLNLNSKFKLNQLKVNSIFRHKKDKTQLDRGGSFYNDDPNYTSEKESNHWLIKVEDKYLESKLHSSIQYSGLKIIRSADNFGDEDNSSQLHEKYKSATHKITNQNNIFWSPHYSTILGLETSYEEGENESSFQSKKSSNSFGSFVAQHFKRSNFLLIAGARNERHEKYGNNLTYKLSSKYNINQVNIKASVNSGLKSPSLYQLHSPAYGNQNLGPEKSVSTDIELSFNHSRFHSSLALFRTNYSNLIDFDSSTSKYINSGKSKTKGFELEHNQFLNSFLSFKSSYEFLQAIKVPTGEYLVRRARQKFKFSLDYLVNDWTSLSGNFSYFSKRKDYHPINSNIIELPSYRLVELNSLFKVSDSQSFSFKIENLLNQSYEKIAGYSTNGRTFIGQYLINFN